MNVAHHDDAPPPAVKQLSQRVFNWLFGYDYFLAHRSVDGKSYALALHGALTARGNELDCFLDVKNYGAGGSLRVMEARALRKTTRLIVIVTPRAHDVDSYLRTEVKHFKLMHPGGVIVPIGVEGETLSRERYRDSWIFEELPNIGDTICIYETAEPSGNWEQWKPSPRTVAKLLNDFSEERGSTKRLRWIRRVAVLLLGLLCIAVAFGVYAIQKRNQAERETRRAEKETREANRQLGHVQWSSAEQARDSEGGAIWGAHLFATAALAYRKADEPGLTENALLASHFSLQKSSLRLTLLHGGPGNVVRGAVFTKDERRVLTWGQDEVARLWDITSGSQKPLQTLQHEEEVVGAVFARDESRVLTWCRDGTVCLWVLEGNRNELLQSFDGEASAPSREPCGAAFTNNESQVLTWSSDRGVKLWEIGAESEKPLQTFEHDSGVLGAVLTKDENHLLTWSIDGTARLWVMGPGARQPPQILDHQGEMIVGSSSPVLPFPGMRQMVGARFSADERRVLTWGLDRTARLWLVGKGGDKPVQSFRNPDLSETRSEIEGAIFTRDESRVLTWGGRAAQLWPVGQHVTEPLQVFQIPTEDEDDGVGGAEFTRDESRLLTWREEGSARLWSVGSAHAAPLKRFDHVRLGGARFTPDGSGVLTWGVDGTARLWAIGNSVAPLQVFEHERVSGAMFSTDGTRLLTWGGAVARLWTIDAGGARPLRKILRQMRVDAPVRTADGTRQLIYAQDVATLWPIGEGAGQSLQTFKQRGGYIHGAMFSPNGKRLLTWSDDDQARVWTVGMGKEPFATFQHEGLSEAEFTDDANEVTTRSDDGTTRHWSLRTDPNVPDTERITELESISGATLSGSELKFLSFDDWLKRREQLDSRRVSERASR